MVQVDLAMCIIVHYVDWQYSEAKNYWNVMELSQILQNWVEYWLPIRRLRLLSETVYYMMSFFPPAFQK
jgi:hypothetical protein